MDGLRKVPDNVPNREMMAQPGAPDACRCGPRGGSLAAPLIIQQKNSEDERSGPIRGQPASARPRRGHRALIKAARFANRRNSYCGTMACLDHAKLANSLIRKASHFSLGSASKIKDLSLNPWPVSNNRPISGDGQAWTWVDPVSCSFVGTVGTKQPKDLCASYRK